MNIVKFMIIISLALISCKSNTENPQTEENKSEKIEKSKWEIVDIVDEFGDPTGKKSILGLFKGKMSNSATNNADLTVKVNFEDKSTLMTFYEYGDMQGNLPDGKFFNIDIKKENGEIEKLNQFTYKNMLFDDSLLKVRILEQKKPLKVSIDLSRANQYDNTKYIFEIDPSGLVDLID